MSYSLARRLLASKLRAQTDTPSILVCSRSDPECPDERGSNVFDRTMVDVGPRQNRELTDGEHADTDGQALQQALEAEANPETATRCTKQDADVTVDLVGHAILVYLS